MASQAQFVKIVHLNGISGHTYDHSSNVHRNWKHIPDDGSFMDRNMSGRVMITKQPTQQSGSSGQF